MRRGQRSWRWGALGLWSSVRFSGEAPQGFVEGRGPPDFPILPLAGQAAALLQGDQFFIQVYS